MGMSIANACHVRNLQIALQWYKESMLKSKLMKAQKKPKTKQKMKFSRYVVGIDEAGRGPLAGPVAVGVFCISAKLLARHGATLFAGVRDSKKLTNIVREEWFVKIKNWKKEGLADFCVCFRGPSSIDAKGIVPSIRLAMRSALKKIGCEAEDCRVYLDGSLRAPVEYLSQETIIGGDDKVAVISLASIAAKVLRDRKMEKLGKKIPAYGFEKHKGYGTKGHYSAIKKEGITKHHRTSYLKKIH